MSLKSDYYDHELNRVQSMTENQLYTRYGKMSDTRKIEALHKVLMDTNLYPSLQMTIEGDHPHLTPPSGKSQEWMLFREVPEQWGGQNHEYVTFVLPEGVENYLLVSGPSPIRVPKETVQYAIEDARVMWDRLIKEGWRLEEANCPPA